MTLADLLEPFAPPPSARGVFDRVEVGGITDDSRELRAGDVFVAVAGAVADGHRHAAAAVEAGASAVLAEHPLDLDHEVPVVVIPELKRLRGAIASRCFGDPSREAACVGVTGTNGKTSVACFAADMLGRLGETAGYLGTIGWGTLDRLEAATLTTGSAIAVQRRMRTLVADGVHWIVMEVSSHALDQHRVDAVAFEYAVFTNLTRDHLDYHPDYAAYGAAKARLFDFPGLRAAVINVDDAFGRELSRGIRAPVELISYGAGDADVRWDALEFTSTGVSGRWFTPWGERSFSAPVYGAFSVANLSAAVAVLCHAGFDLNAVVAAAGRVAGVPGRMEFFHTEPGIVVDYAHTPDALEKMLMALRPHVSGRLICVCGCGGDRDPGKRPLMARTACEHADVIWLTSDNPRSEDPQSIIDAMRTGLPANAEVYECVDRRAAIERAVAMAGSRDLVVIAGKGHEAYQEIAGQRIPFSDRAIAAELSGEI